MSAAPLFEDQFANKEDSLLWDFFIFKLLRNKIMRNQSAFQAHAKFEVFWIIVDMKIR